MKIDLRNNIHVNTDSFGCFQDEWPSLGFVNYGEGKKYYSYDEVEDLILNNKIDENEFWRDEDGVLRLKESYCSACTCFDIVCGKIVHETKHDNLVEYAKKIGLVSDEFRVVKGWFGNKFIRENEDSTYDMTYTLTKEYKGMNLNFVEKVCVGAIKKLAGDRRRIHGKDGVEVTRYFKCEEVYFDKDTKVLHINKIPKNYITGEITNVIKKLDLELWILFNKDKEWSRFFTTSIAAVRDCGQHHWFDRLYKDTSEKNQKECNLRWFDRELGEEW